MMSEAYFGRFVVYRRCVVTALLQMFLAVLA